MAYCDEMLAVLLCEVAHFERLVHLTQDTIMKNLSLLCVSGFLVAPMISTAQSKDVTKDMPRIERGKMVNAAPQPANQSGPLRQYPSSGGGTETRLPVGSGVSLGGSASPPSGNVRIETK